MAKLKDFAIGTKDAFLFDPEAIHELPGYNVRDMDSPLTIDHIRRMADSIKEFGTLTFPPITVTQKDGKVYVIAGYCRRRAFIIARKEGAPVKGILAIANNQTEEERVLDLLNSNDGLPLTPMEKAAVVNRLLAFEWTVAEIAKRRGVTEQAIRNLMALTSAPKEVRDLVDKGEVSATMAVNAVKEHGPEAGEVLKTAVSTAKAEGKKKATPKHVAPKKPKEKMVKLSAIKEAIGKGISPFYAHEETDFTADEVYQSIIIEVDKL